MSKDFSRIIKLLRKEKKLSQKQVSSDLKISQSLLSHYEKGIRECSLENLAKFAEYYGVSTDYLLGRTPERYNEIIDITDDVSKNKRDTVSTLVNKRLIQNTQDVLYDYLMKIGSRKLSNYVSNYLMLATYNMLREIYSANEDNPQDMFAVHKDVYSGFSTAAMQVLSTRISCATDKLCASDFIKQSAQLEISPDILANEYPHTASSVFNLIQHAEVNMKFKK